MPGLDELLDPGGAGTSSGTAGGTGSGGKGGTGGRGPVFECPAGTFRGEPTGACTSFGQCSPGEYVAGEGTPTSDRVCANCPASSYSTAFNAASCTPWSSCEAGMFASQKGSSTSDRECALCPDGTFSTIDDAPSCTAWLTCPMGSSEQTAGTGTSDRVCLDDEEWLRQFGAEHSDVASSVDVDDSGNIYVAGHVGPSVNPQGPFDVFLRKYDNAGTLLWTREFGSSSYDRAASMNVDGSGNIVVAGTTSGALPGQTHLGSTDFFLRKYDSAGTELWTKQLGTSGTELIVDMITDAGDNIYVTGQTYYALPGQTFLGGADAYVMKFDASGNEQWARQFGSSAWDLGISLSADDSGGLYVAGYADGELPDQKDAGLRDAFLRKYDTQGSEQWTRQFGTSDHDAAVCVSVDGSGGVHVVGVVDAALPGQEHQGATDSFVRKYDREGNELWTRQFGTSSGDYVRSVTVDGNGSAFLVGETTSTLTGQTSAGGTDIFVQVFDRDGRDQATRQFGSSSDDTAIAVVANDTGGVIVAGRTYGTLPGQASAGYGDAFIAKLLF